MRSVDSLHVQRHSTMLIGQPIKHLSQCDSLHLELRSPNFMSQLYNNQYVVSSGLPLQGGFENRVST